MVLFRILEKGAKFGEPFIHIDPCGGGGERIGREIECGLGEREREREREREGRENVVFVSKLAPGPIAYQHTVHVHRRLSLCLC